VSTFLVTLGVGLAAILVVGIALSDPDQPPTIRRPAGRGRASGTIPAPAPIPAPVAIPPAAPVAAPSRARRRMGALARLRSGLALVILVTFVGVLLALLVGTALALGARALRHAVG
jgi:hypothetical protein